MSDSSFIPLTPVARSAGDRPNLRVTVMSPGDAQSFRPLGQSLPAAAAHAAHNGAEPQIELQHDGDRVASIRVHCSCGQVIELSCLYDPSPAVAPAPPSPPPASDPHVHTLLEVLTKSPEDNSPPPAPIPPVAASAPPAVPAAAPAPKSKSKSMK
ncbi:MAG: hypothetical protein U1F98_08120 [Verrucomicrobiota bacterium]